MIGKQKTLCKCNAATRLGRRYRRNSTINGQFNSTNKAERGRTVIGLFEAFEDDLFD